jgi:putative component of membrane protein insertase Oxa1/YidC/SpoIIIJ protein YidD
MHDIPQGNLLYLYCTDLDYFPDDYTAFIKSCQDKKLLGQPSTNLGAHHYLVGDDFLHYVSFLGCSPYLKVYPEHENDTDCCSAYIPDTAQSIRFLAGQQVTAPRCPACKKAIHAGYDHVEAWLKDQKNSIVQCEHCNKTISLYELDWRRNAGFFNFAIAISNIFPKEAIPNQGLLDWLQGISGRQWRYFYV